MSEPVTVTLGGTAYPVAPLTLGQMRTVAPAFTRIGIDTPDGMAAQLTVIHAGIRAANPGFKLEDLDAIPGVTLAEIYGATATIGGLMGFTLTKTAGNAPAEGATTVPAPAPETVEGGEAA